jgi:DNA-binding transcriptional regulator YdaS (Cro superfamily)
MDLKTYITSGARGRATQLAQGLGVSLSYLSQMANGSSAISADRCVLVERLTGGEVTRKDLHPDDWAKFWPEIAGMQTFKPTTRTIPPTREVLTDTRAVRE